MSLSEKGELAIDGQRLSQQVTSCYATKHILMYTTLAHVLCCVSLHYESTDALIQQAALAVGDESMRAVERGARIVRSHGISVVLQMPRGNLETVSPRARLVEPDRAGTTWVPAAGRGRKRALTGRRYHD